MLVISGVQGLVGLTDPEALYRDTERIAIKRPPDSPGHAAVREYITAQFDRVRARNRRAWGGHRRHALCRRRCAYSCVSQASGGLAQQWNVEIDEFQSDTPLGGSCCASPTKCRGA